MPATESVMEITFNVTRVAWYFKAALYVVSAMRAIVGDRDWMLRLLQFTFERGVDLEVAE